MSDWLYSQYGQTKGPVSESTLLNMILKEELELDSYVMNEKDGLWKKVKDIQPLLDKIHAPEKAIPHNVTFGKDFLEEGGEARIGNLYYYISIRRFVLMTILSCGLFQIYWFYKQWYYWAHTRKLVHRSFDREGSWWFFPLMIFEKIETDRELNAVARADFNGTLLFWMWIGSGVVVNLLVIASGSVSILSNIIYFFGSVAEIVFLIPIQRYINRVNEKMGNAYDKPGVGQYLCIVAGIAVVLYALSIRQIWKLFLV
jgi:hypothetical protein